ncbi:lipopolysaccharide biosynthesis protein [Acinetobacter variabilis]|uniref:lipopolysaccharide biosynthesis protein n=1 Tax=Acinetobacter variabilis TaxID=70346 RepID=UPI0026737874|nr:oligosaccharide flippase family protein [Acinetobacter variabilis]WKT73379.1 oligosaccharide flippase family protein [Acinetobacter variabilis]
MFKNKFLKDSVWTVMGSGANAVQSLLITVILANSLGKILFGEYAFLLNTLTTVSIFCLYGANVSLILFISKYQNISLKSDAIYTIIKLSTLLWLIGIVITFFLKQKYDLELHKWLVLVLTSSSLILKSIYEAIIQGEQKFIEFAKINICILFVSLIFFYSFTISFGLYGALTSLLVINFLKIFMISKVLDFKISLNIFNFNISKEVLSFSSPLAAQEYVYYFSSWLLMYLLLYYGDYAQISSYSVAMQLCMIVAFIPGVLKNIILARFGSNSGNSKDILKKNIFLNLLITILTSIVLYLFLPFVLKIYGENYSDLYKIMPFLLIMIILNSVSNVYFQYCLVFGRWSYNLALKIFRDFGVFFIFYLLFFFEFNALKSVVISALLINIFYYILVKIYSERVKRELV